MKVAALGQLDGPVLVSGAPASNLQALMALLGEAARRRVDRAALICNGGLVGPCGDPGAVVSTLRTLGGPVLAAETERRLGAGPRRGGPLAGRDWYRLADDRLPDRDRMWLDALPGAAVFRHRGRQYGVIAPCAGTAPEADLPECDLGALAARLEPHLGRCDTIFSSGAGPAFRRVAAGVEWIGTGMLGLPPGDGSRRTRFVMIRAGQARLHRLDYDLGGAVARMRQLGLDPRWQAALCGGSLPGQELQPGPRAA
ncbi:hypothetical protein [Mangrovicoccus algicola]|uniref:Metallophosphoesterase n=1 Tax=Mangrovicoccus algicola TaxID=2771008 RepID=A0A8J6YWJ4_9RHOB|nr:hypothetical protein [Mangrovicoccus algicola]MBE3637101.1 hypothetical protein [Mangrovicoccus algicola]